MSTWIWAAVLVASAVLTHWGAERVSCHATRTVIFVSNMTRDTWCEEMA